MKTMTNSPLNDSTLSAGTSYSGESSRQKSADAISRNDQAAASSLSTERTSSASESGCSQTTRLRDDAAITDQTKVRVSLVAQDGVDAAGFLGEFTLGAFESSNNVKEDPDWFEFRSNLILDRVAEYLHTETGAIYRVEVVGERE